MDGHLKYVKKIQSGKLILIKLVSFLLSYHVSRLLTTIFETSCLNIVTVVMLSYYCIFLYFKFTDMIDNDKRRLPVYLIFFENMIIGLLIYINNLYFENMCYYVLATIIITVGLMIWIKMIRLNNIYRVLTNNHINISRINLREKRANLKSSVLKLLLCLITVQFALLNLVYFKFSIMLIIHIIVSAIFINYEINNHNHNNDIMTMILTKIISL